jgi:hypothetical protein
MAKELDDWNKGFICGFVAAVVIDIRNHGMRTEVVDLWRCNKLTIQKMRAAGVDEGDIEVLKEHWSELNNA